MSLSLFGRTAFVAALVLNWASHVVSEMYFVPQRGGGSDLYPPPPPIPRGYQPPPAGISVDEYNAQRATHYRPQQQQYLSMSSYDTQPSTQQKVEPSPVTVERNSQPLLINTLIQVFANRDKAKTTLIEARKASTSTRDWSDQASPPQPSDPPSRPTSSGRVEITRDLDLKSGQLLPSGSGHDSSARQADQSPNVVSVKAFATANTSQISDLELERELEKEVKHSIPAIIGQMERATSMPRVSATTRAPTSLPTLTRNPLESVNPSELETAISEGLGEVEAGEGKKTTASLPSTPTTLPLPTTTTLPIIFFSRRPNDIPTTTASSSTSLSSGLSDTTPLSTEDTHPSARPPTLTTALPTILETTFQPRSLTSASPEVPTTSPTVALSESASTPAITESTTVVLTPPTTEGTLPPIHTSSATSALPSIDETTPTSLASAETVTITSPAATSETASTRDNAGVASTASVLATSNTEFEATATQSITTSPTNTVIGIESTTLTAVTVGEQVDQSATTEATEHSTTPSKAGINDTLLSAVECLPNGVRAKFSLPPQFNGSVVVNGHEGDSHCSKELSSSSGRNEGQQTAAFFAPHCGILFTPMQGEESKMATVVLNVVHDKRLSVGSDRTFVVQCLLTPSTHEAARSTVPSVFGTSVEELVETDLDVEHPPMYQVSCAFDELETAHHARCRYTLRRDSPNGAVLQSAIVGQLVYHRWECDGGKVTNAMFGFNVHDCESSNSTTSDATNYRLVDEDGCSTDLSLLEQIHYASDRMVAYVKGYAFATRNATSVRFSCRVSLCLRNGNDCDGYSPPMCRANNDDNHTSTGAIVDVSAARRRRHHDHLLHVALSSEVQTDEIVIQAPITADALTERVSMGGPLHAAVLMCITCLLVGSLLCLLSVQLVRRRMVGRGRGENDECSSTTSTSGQAPCGTAESNSNNPAPIYVDWSANRIHRIVTPKMSKRYASSVHPESDGDDQSVRTEAGVVASPRKSQRPTSLQSAHERDSLTEHFALEEFSLQSHTATPHSPLPSNKHELHSELRTAQQNDQAMSAEKLELDRIEDTFQLLDNRSATESGDPATRDKSIAAGDIGKCLRMMGLAPTEGKISKLAEPFQGARINVKEFIPIYRELRKPENASKSVGEMTDCLATFGSTGSADEATRLGISTLRLLLTTMGEKMSNDEVDGLLRGFAVGKDGEIDIAEFMRHINSLNDP